MKNFFYQKKKILIIIGIIVLLGSIIGFKTSNKKEPIIVDALETKVEKKESKEEIETFNVDIKGAIANPGVYKVVSGSIVNDVISYAGGLTKNATTNNINLSKKVNDEMVIYIYTKSELNKLMESTNKKETVVNKECSAPKESAEITNCIKNNPSSIITNNGSNTDSNTTSETANTLININTASIAELTTLPGIGEAKAKSIIEYRDTNGNFNTIEDVKLISGIGDAMFEKIKAFITV